MKKIIGYILGLVLLFAGFSSQAQTFKGYLYRRASVTTQDTVIGFKALNSANDYYAYFATDYLGNAIIYGSSDDILLNGNVTIGASSGTRKFNIVETVDAATPMVFIENTVASGKASILFRSSSPSPDHNWVIGSNGDDDTFVFTNGSTMGSTDVMLFYGATNYVQVTGKLGVGRIPTAYPLEVAGNIRAVSGHVLFSAGYGAVDMIEAQYGFFPRDGSDQLTIKTADTVRMLINSTGNVGINDVTPTEGTLTVGGTGYFSDTLTTNGLVVKVYTTNVSNPPTDAELDAAFGTPAAVGTGWTAIIDDNAGGVNIYRVVSSGTVWGIFTAVIAL